MPRIEGHILHALMYLSYLTVLFLLLEVAGTVS